jgi:hypothetical protein
MITLALTLLIAQGEPAAEKHVVVHREDFAYGARLQTDPGHALQRLVLPASIYDAITRPDVGDLAVFNGSGAQVPHALVRVSDSVKETPDVKLPVFPLKADANGRGADTVVTVEHSENGAIATVKTSSTEQSTLVAYFVDLTALKHPIRSLTFKFGDGGDSFIKHLRIDVSDDLQYWSTQVYDTVVASFAHEGHRIDKETVETDPFTSKYMRISWDGGPPSRPLEEVIVGLAASTTEPPREFANVDEVTTPRPQVYRFRLPGFRPVDRVRLHLPEDNTLAQATLASASNPDGAWTTRYSGIIYRVDSKDVSTQTIPVEDVADPYWQLEISSVGGGIGNGSPTFEVGWQPHEVQFVARGEPPFVLAYGNANTAVAAFDPKALATMALTGEGGEAMGMATITEAKVELGGSAKLTPEPPDASLPVRRIVLWLSLAAAVLLLGWMSVRLFRQLGT